MTRLTRRAAIAAATTAVLLAAGAASASAAAGPDRGGHQPARHVLLISIDGMHQSDLDWYVANHPNSTLAQLTHSGSEYTDAATSNPSDSDPGGTALMTGGNPKSTGVFYDVEYS
ncbi:MAG TPA: alkaline phosphatase family protein, partial [Micromonosporaceae bacterium]